MRVGEALHGPLGSGTRAARDVVLEPQAIVERYAVVTDVPEVISQAFGAAAGRRRSRPSRSSERASGDGIRPG